MKAKGLSIASTKFSLSEETTNRLSSVIEKARSLRSNEKRAEEEDEEKQIAAWYVDFYLADKVTPSF